MLDRLEKLSALMTLENNSLSCVVYAINQKGRSTPVLIQDFEIGRIQPYRAGKWPPPSTVPESIDHIYSPLSLFCLFFFFLSPPGAPAKQTNKKHSDRTTSGRHRVAADSCWHFAHRHNIGSINFHQNISEPLPRCRLLLSSVLRRQCKAERCDGVR